MCFLWRQQQQQWRRAMFATAPPLRRRASRSWLPLAPVCYSSSSRLLYSSPLCWPKEAVADFDKEESPHPPRHHAAALCCCKHHHCSATLTERRRCSDSSAAAVAAVAAVRRQCDGSATRRRRRGGGVGGRGATTMKERTDGRTNERTDAALYYTCNTRSTTMATG